MTIPDPLHQDEPAVDKLMDVEDTWVFTLNWYSWFGALVEAIRAERADLDAQLDDIRARLDALEP